MGSAGAVHTCGIDEPPANGVDNFDVPLGKFSEEVLCCAVVERSVATWVCMLAKNGGGLRCNRQQ